jgi:hypothetical protein
VIFTTDLATRLSCAGGRSTDDLLAAAVVVLDESLSATYRQLSRDVVDLHITFTADSEPEAVEIGRRIRRSVGAGVMAGTTRRRHDLERLDAILSPAEAEFAHADARMWS